MACRKRDQCWPVRRKEADRTDTRSTVRRCAEREGRERRKSISRSGAGVEHFERKPDGSQRPFRPHSN